MSVTITAVDWSDPAAVALRERQVRELVERYDGDGEPGPEPTGSDVKIFLLARYRVTGVPVGCGGLRPLSDGTAEIKRMYVVPEHRGEGISRELLSALEAEAAVLGWPLLRLVTGVRQPEAIGLYSSSGYARIENFGPYAGAAESICFEKRLLTVS
jgi:GNAT superfamily N-acetyltransferase